MRKILAGAAVAGAALAGVLAAGPAHADDVSVVSPTDGTTFQPGDTIPFEVAGSSTWRADVSCDDGSTHRVSSSSPSIIARNSRTRAVSCTADFTDTETASDIGSVDYVISAPPPKANELRKVAIRGGQSTFYPRVRDGYRDSVEVTFRARANATVTMRVVNSDGRVVRSLVEQRPSGYADYEGSWAHWNGRNAAGKPVALGTYRLQLVSSAPGYITARATVRVQVATGWRTVSGSRAVHGANAWYDAYDSHTRSCYISRSYYPSGEDLDCWGGRFAQAAYHLRVPAGATITGWWASGRRGCCDNGRVLKSGVRTKSTSFRVQVRVTGWASYTVTGVGVRYRYRARI